MRPQAHVSRMNPALKTQAEPASHHPPTGPASWTDGLTARRLSVVIALFLFALYPGVILGTHSFFHRDFGLFTYPVAHYTHASFWRGEVPLWNPLSDCGVPFLAQWNTAVCYPLSLIYALFPLPWSLNVFCLGHLVLAGAGMYLLAYSWTQNRLAASIAGLAFALNGLMFNSLIWTSNLAALSWQPLVMLCVERAWRLGGRHIALAALAGMMQMLAGAPEIILFTWLLLVMLWIGQLWHKKIPPLPALRRLVVVVLLIAGLAAIQIFPFLDLLTHSERDLSYKPDDWPMPVWGWANLVVPLFHCTRNPLGVWMQNGQSWTSSYYLGIGVLALALLGAWRARQPKVWWLAGAAVAGLVLALGNNGFVYTWLKAIVPGIGLARYPIKFVALPAFAIPLLAAWGFNCLQPASSENAGRKERSLFILGACLLLLAGLTLAAARWFPKPGDSWPATWHSAASRALFLIAIIGAVVAWVRAPSSRLRGFIGVAILALIGFDAATAGLRQNPTVVIKAFGPLELNMSFRPQYGDSRAMLSRQVQSFLSTAVTADPLYYYIGVRGSLSQNCNLLEGIPKVDGFCSLHLREETDIYSMLYAGTNPIPAHLIDFLGVAQISAPDTLFAWQQRPSFLPLATAGQRPVFAGELETLKGLEAEDFDPRRIVYLPLSARDQVAATGFSPANITNQQFAADHVGLTVEAAAPTMVVVAQSFYHNWRAFVDGRPVPLWRANHAYQALAVPAGRHQVTLIYKDLAFRAGAFVSALTLLVCLINLACVRPPVAQWCPQPDTCSLKTTLETRSKL
jgi:hypothetical protein